MSEKSIRQDGAKKFIATYGAVLLAALRFVYDLIGQHHR